MKILAICGSPRKGNTEIMLNKVLEGAESKKAETEIVLLRTKKIEHCTGCDMCWNKEKPCYILDDYQAVKEKMLDADALVFGSPNYFRNVSSLMKSFMDRTNDLVKKTKLKGKKAGFVCVGGQNLNNTMKCLEIMQNFIEDHELDLAGSVIAKADAPGEINESEATLEECRKLGEELADI